MKTRLKQATSASSQEDSIATPLQAPCLFKSLVFICLGLAGSLKTDFRSARPQIDPEPLCSQPGKVHGGAALAGALARHTGGGQPGHGAKAGHGAHGALRRGQSTQGRRCLVSWKPSVCGALSLEPILNNWTTCDRRRLEEYWEGRSSCFCIFRIKHAYVKPSSLSHRK